MAEINRSAPIIDGVNLRVQFNIRAQGTSEDTQRFIDRIDLMNGLTAVVADLRSQRVLTDDFLDGIDWVRKLVAGLG